MNGISVGSPYSTAARDAALAAIGGDSFDNTLPGLLQQVVIASNANGTTGYVPSYATQAEADAVATAMAANDVLYVDSTGPIAGPGSFIKTITLVPASLEPTFKVNIDGTADMTLWETGGSSFATVPPPVTLPLGITTDWNINFTTLVGRAIVTGYFTPTV